MFRQFIVPWEDGQIPVKIGGVNQLKMRFYLQVELPDDLIDKFLMVNQVTAAQDEKCPYGCG